MRFCGEYSTRNNPLHNVSTFGLDTRVRKCATVLQDKKVLAKLSANDLVALEAKYSAPCLARLKESNRKAKKTGQALDDRRPSRLRSWIPLLKSYAWSVL